MREISIDGKKANYAVIKFMGIKLILHNELFVQDVMRVGNCLTVLNTTPVFNLECFQNPNLFDEVVKYVYWTFNPPFLRQIEKYLRTLLLEELKDCKEALKANPTAYFDIDDKKSDQVIKWCREVKNRNLFHDNKFAEMFQRDAENRKEVLILIEKQLATVSAENQTGTALPETSFEDMLNPVFGTVEETLKYMADKIEEADFRHQIFEKVAKTKDGKNQQGLNSEIAAMVKEFIERGYFKSDYDFKEIFKAFGKYTENEAGKDYDEVSFKHDRNYKKYLKELQDIEITDFSTPKKIV